MKISEMTCDQATAAILRISGPFSRLADDEDLMKIVDDFKSAKPGSRGAAVRTVMGLVPRIVTFGLAKHKHDLYEIVGALTMQTSAKVGSMNFREMVDAVRDSLDDVLTSFFPQSGKLTKKVGGFSSAPSPDTAGTAGTP